MAAILKLPKELIINVLCRTDNIINLDVAIPLSRTNKHLYDTLNPHIQWILIQNAWGKNIVKSEDIQTVTARRVEFEDIYNRAQKVS